MDTMVAIGGLTGLTLTQIADPAGGQPRRCDLSASVQSAADAGGDSEGCGRQKAPPWPDTASREVGRKACLVYPK